MFENNMKPRGRQRFVLMLAALALLAVGGLAWLESGRRAPASPEIAKRADSSFHPSKEQWAGLNIAEVKTVGFRSILETDGNIAFDEDYLTPVFSPYTGRVSRLIAKLGDIVQKGAPLMAVDASEDVQGQSDLVTARANLATARATEKRQHDLYDSGAAALKDWRQSQADLVVAESAMASAHSRLRILGKSDAEVDALGQAPTLTEALVKAPISGTVTQRQVGVGQYISSAAGGAATSVYTIADLSSVWLVANVREGDASALRLGQDAEVRVMALPGQIFKAKIAWIASSVDPGTHRLPVRAVVRNRNGELKPQMFASFAIVVSGTIEAPAVSQGALMYDGAATRVFVVGKDGSVTGRSVSAGRSRDGLVEITSGLKVGEKVVTSGTLFVDRVVGGD